MRLERNIRFVERRAARVEALRTARVKELRIEKIRKRDKWNEEAELFIELEIARNMKLEKRLPKGFQYER